MHARRLVLILPPRPQQWVDVCTETPNGMPVDYERSNARTRRLGMRASLAMLRLPKA